jgi:rhodanese-related sulfurtransferase
MQGKIIKIEELKSWLDEKKDFLLVDVMNPEYFSEKHIPGSFNAPVYEIAFLEHIGKLTDDKQKTIVVYNEDPKSLATADAGSKLLKAGFENVYEFPGGLTAWEKAGNMTEKGPTVSIPTIVDGEYKIDQENSIVGWVGRNAKNAHRGKITIKSGNVVIAGQDVTGGEIILDMTTIKDDDLTDDMWRGVLESHLKSSDFFDVENFPEASFKFEAVEKISGAHVGRPNYSVNGVLTIKGITNPVSFLAMIVPMEDGLINGQAHFDFDRTLWNVRYGSEKFFEKLGMHLVNDIVSLELFLVAKK